MSCWRARNLLSPCEGACDVPLLDTPDIRQLGPYDCGRAAALIVLRYYGMSEADAATSAGRIPVDKHDGTDPAQLAAWARHEGWHVNEGWMDLHTVRHHGAQGTPVILLATLHGGGHWVVSRGIARRSIYLQDPATGRDKHDIDEFTKVWHDANRYGARFRQWGIVMVPQL